MDNLSHSVAGLAAGEFIHRSLAHEADEARQGMRRRLLLLSCWLASNFPDLDLVLTPLLPEPLGYLLHHRGHTHTLLYALPQALLTWGLIWLLWPAARRLLRESANARRGFFLSVAVGLLLHMMMDYLNSYGIHPFHPFDSRWFYGDMVFILEPVFWIVFGAPLAMMLRPSWIRGVLLAALIGIPLYFTVQGFLLWISMLALALCAVALALAQLKAGTQGRTALVLAALLGLAFVGMQNVSSGQGKKVIARELKRMDPATQVLDVAMTSFPSNPVCWTFVSIESNEDAGTYRLRRGMFSLRPDLVPVTQCPPRFLEAQEPATEQFVLVAEAQGSLAALRELRENNCHFEAWLRFARAPVVAEQSASDMRFSSTPRGNFTTMRFEDFVNRECAANVPRWEFPRADLLSGTESRAASRPD